ncbi:MAG: acyl-CoA thioesterase [Microbacteriaceae bacterium]|nr:acyl-CoA thioesterase [Microbacteriaceae bacterium]
MARVLVELPLRWGDQDEYGHVNNVSFARYLEEARVRVFGPGGVHTGMDGLFHGTHDDPHKMLLATQCIEFIAVLEYSTKPAKIELWIGKVGGSSFEVHCEILDGASQERKVVARAISNLVIVDGTSLKPKRLTDAERQAVEPWGDAPLVLRRM